MERDDDNTGAKPKQIKGKARPKKVIEESRPSPLGRRIVPRVDSAIKVKAEKEAIRKQKLKVHTLMTLNIRPDVLQVVV